MALRWVFQVAVLSSLVKVVQGDCKAPPLSLAIENVTLSDGIAKNRGVHVDLGTQPEGFRITFTLNNTRVRNAQDCQAIGNATLESKCVGASGGVYDLRLNTFKTSAADFNVTRVDPRPNDAIFLPGSDQALIGNKNIPDFPFEVWHANSTNKSGLALGPDSSVLTRLVDYGHAPSKFFGIYFGSRSQNFPRDGQVTVGGYDAARVKNKSPGEWPFTNFTMAQLGVESPCPLQVQIKDVVLNNSGGSHQLMPDARSTVAACIDPLQNQFTFTETMYALWANFTRHNNSAEYTDQTYPPESKENPILIDSLTVTLSNGYTVVVPKQEMVSLERGANDGGEYAIISDNVMAAVGRGPTDFGQDIPILGGTFLSQNYLFVDYENNNFGLAPANTDADAKIDLVKVCIESKKKHSKSGKNVGVIVGPVIAGVAVLALLVGGVWWRRRKQISTKRPRVDENRDGFGKVFADPGRPVDQKD